MNTLRSLLPRTACAVALAVPLVCLAHTGTDGGGHHTALAAWMAGFVHPFTGLDHLAAMVALGVWSALTTRRVWIAPLAFALSLMVGAVLGALGLSLPAVEPMIAASLLVLGLLVASRATLPALVGIAGASVFAMFHGIAHGRELAGPAQAYAIVGMVGATALLHALGVGLGVAVRDRKLRLLPRVAGVSVALFGAALLGSLA
ncbi:HupE/UreJ family protein [Piscinibacter sp.]|uniref:HupE/UreJ family protein n=1 Tax=Piscinibacter sp. TaxID=1903157 RepID=UPI003559BD17